MTGHVRALCATPLRAPKNKIINKKNKKIMKKHETWRIIPTLFGYIQISSLHGKNEMIENIRIAGFLANKSGYSIFLLARSEHTKTPDSKNATLNIFQEYKVNKTPTKSAIDNMLRSAAKQANHVVLEILSDISDDDLKSGIRRRVIRTENIETITILRDGKAKTYTREQITEKKFTL